MPITLILIIIAVIFTLLMNRNRRRVGNGNRVYRSDGGCKALRHKLSQKVNRDVAERLIRLEKLQHPGKSERWYLEKVIYDLQRGR